MHIGMLTDYVTVDLTNGPGLATQTFRRNMLMRGHEVTLIGPSPGGRRQPPADSVLLSASNFRAYSGVRFAWPWPRKSIYEVPNFDVVHAHSNSLLMHWAPMVRELHGIPCISTNTVYLPGFVKHAIPEVLLSSGPGKRFFDALTKRVEASFAAVYNAGDGLIVQCQGLVDYWREVGMIDVPIHVIQRPIDVRNFNRAVGKDPYRPEFAKGGRLLIACRQAHEKAIDQVVRIFARHILPHHPEASLTLVGDGPERVKLEKLAAAEGVANRCDFVGERPQIDLPDFYSHGDLFFYTSMIETFGQVISESLWRGMPVVAKADGMGVSHQVKHGLNGELITPSKGEDEELGATVVKLLKSPETLKAYGEQGAARQRETSAPEVVYAKYEAAYASAQEHMAQHPAKWVNRRDFAMKLWLAKHHLFPWIWKHAGLLSLGSVSNNYKPRTDLQFDAPPENPADEAYAHNSEPES